MSARQPAPSALRHIFMAIALVMVLACVQTAFGQITTQAVDLVGPVAIISEHHEYPETTERRLRQTWTFAPDGAAVERVWLTYDVTDGSLRSRQVTTYDEDGHPLASVTMNPDGEPMGQTVYRYDGDGGLVEQATYDADGVETRRVVYERDAAGNAVAEEFWVQGALDRRYERQFNEQGLLLEERMFRDGRLTEVETYREPGRVADIVRYDDAGEVDATGTLVSSEHGTEEWIFYDAAGNSTGGFFWTYGDNGLVRERREVDSEGREIIYTYAYEFDQRGNWVRQVVTEELGGGSTSVYEISDREIAYH